MDTAGQLVISGRWGDGAWRDIHVSLQRPALGRFFVGKVPDDVANWVPRLYSLCACAQEAACQAALTAAGGRMPVAPNHPALWTETLHEHLWRLLLDWPRVLGLAPAQKEFVAWRALRGQGNFLAQTGQLLDAVLRPLAQESLRALAAEENIAEFDFPPLTPEQWLPYWRANSPEKPALLAPECVASAYLRRYQQVRMALGALAGSSDFPVAGAGEAGWGIGQTQTARGLLTHGVRLVDGKVADYRVWAPTDCFFADAAPLMRLLAGRTWQSGEAARLGLEQAILALDPCLPYNLKVET